MASAPASDAAPQPRKTTKAKKQTAASKLHAEKTKRAAAKPRLVFIPGSLNDQLSKLDIGESHAKCQRIDLGTIANSDDLNAEAQKFFKAQNSILSGGIAKVRSIADHKSKRFKMERGQYMSASNDALFAFLTVTRME